MEQQWNNNKRQRRVVGIRQRGRCWISYQRLRDRVQKPRPEVSTSAARAPPLPPSRRRFFLLFLDFLQSNCSIGSSTLRNHLFFLGSAESTALDWRLLDLDNGGECEECHTMEILVGLFLVTVTSLWHKILPPTLKNGEFGEAVPHMCGSA